MKKILLLLTSLILVGCTDIGLLGYPGARYAPVSKNNVLVLYSTVPPDNCPQIAISIPPVTSDLSQQIDYLRTAAAKLGGNYVNISILGYTSNVFGSGNKTMTGVIYFCPDEN